MAGSKGPSGGIVRYDDERTLPKQGKPNSRADLYKNGQLYQQRWYDSNGNAQRNRDHTDHGNSAQHPVVPHDHGWYPERNPDWEYPDFKWT